MRHIIETPGPLATLKQKELQEVGATDASVVLCFPVYTPTGFGGREILSPHKKSNLP